MSETAASPSPLNGATLARIARQPTMLLAVGLMVIIVMMVLPVPPIVLDIGLTASFAFAILVFTMTLFIQRPIDFSSFPSVLLMALLLRLSLNISSTKLIIGEGHTGTGAAGGVIEGFAMFIMGGNLFMGLIIFAVLIIVNFMVITKGAGRMAEVGARFALDAMPGKQLAIDADVAAGAISHEEARAMRAANQEEASFLGSLDGVSKFVKGDAIAGLLITMLNLIAGIAMGVFVHRISIGEAVQNYSVLTVGDGLVSQIPAVIISIAAGFLLSKGQGSESVDDALVKQLLTKPAAVGTVAGLMMVFALFPGMPFLPFTLGAGLLGFAAFTAWKKEKAADAEAHAKNAEALEPPKRPATLGDSLDVDEIHVELDRTLSSMLSGSRESLEHRIDKLRKFVIGRYGFVMPPIRVTDSNIGAGQYRISVQGATMGADKVEIGQLLALVKQGEHPDVPGVACTEPVYKADARWVGSADAERLAARGVTVIEPIEVLATHLLETVQNNFERLMSRRALREALEIFVDLSDEMRGESNRRVLEEFVPEKVTPETLQWVMRGLLAEKVSVRNIPLLLEAIAEQQERKGSIDDVIEGVRRTLSFQFLEYLRGPDGTLPLVQLSPSWDETLIERLDISEAATLTGEEFKKLGADLQEALNKAAMAGAYASVAVSGKRRRFIRDALRARGIKNAVIAFEEIVPGSRPAIMAIA